MNWNEFKKLVHELRDKQREIMKGRSNYVMISLAVVDSDVYHSVYFMPHGIDLRTGEVFALHDSGKFGRYNIKNILEELEE